MDSFFPEEDLVRVPPEATRIQSLHAEPYPDGKRILVQIQITPFQVRPMIELVLLDASGAEVASASIVEPITSRLELTMHLREAAAGVFRLEARLMFPDGPSVEPVETAFQLQTTS